MLACSTRFGFGAARWPWRERASDLCVARCWWGLADWESGQWRVEGRHEAASSRESDVRREVFGFSCSLRLKRRSATFWSAAPSLSFSLYLQGAKDCCCSAGEAKTHSVISHMRSTYHSVHTMYPRIRDSPRSRIGSFFYRYELHLRLYRHSVHVLFVFFRLRGLTRRSQLAQCPFCLSQEVRPAGRAGVQRQAPLTARFADACAHSARCWSRWTRPWPATAPRGSEPRRGGPRPGEARQRPARVRLDWARGHRRRPPRARCTGGPVPRRRP